MCYIRNRVALENSTDYIETLSQAGNCFELLNVVPWLKQYGTNPVTGKKMKATDLIKMTWYKNADNKYHCERDQKF